MSLLHVDIRPQALDEIEEAARYIAQQWSSARAAEWESGIFGAIETLREFPRSHAPAPEEETLRADLRQILYKSHRAIFIVREPRVYVLAVRHQARRPIPPETLRERVAGID